MGCSNRTCTGGVFQSSENCLGRKFYVPGSPRISFTSMDTKQSAADGEFKDLRQVNRRDIDQFPSSSSCAAESHLSSTAD